MKLRVDLRSKYLDHRILKTPHGYRWGQDGAAEDGILAREMLADSIHSFWLAI